MGVRPGSRLRLGLGLKLFASYLVVVVVAIGTVLLTAGTLSPTFFDDAMRQMMGGSGMMQGQGSPMQALDAMLAQAFRTSLLQGLLLAGAAALVAAIAVSGFVTSRIVLRVRRLAEASSRLAAGHYAERVPSREGDELGDLARSFNEMAAELETTERRRLELIGDVAHELRTPVATLQGNLEGLLDGVVEPSPRTWAKLQDEVGRLRRLIDDLQQLSRAEAKQLPLRLEAVSAADIVDAAVERLRPQFDEKGLRMDVDVSPSLPVVRTDRERAIQVLTNLLTNALRYTPAPGWVRVAVRQEPGGLQFSVSDSGIGLAAGELPRVFERFYRAEKSRSRAAGGAGIGLTIGKALIEAMGGRIWADSAGLGQGATFGFLLPLAVRSDPLTKS